MTSLSSLSRVSPSLPSYIRFLSLPSACLFASLPPSLPPSHPQNPWHTRRGPVARCDQLTRLQEHIPQLATPKAAKCPEGGGPRRNQPAGSELQRKEGIQSITGENLTMKTQVCAVKAASWVFKFLSKAVKVPGLSTSPVVQIITHHSMRALGVDFFCTIPTPQPPKRTASLQRTEWLAPMYPLFRGSTLPPIKDSPGQYS